MSKVRCFFQKTAGKACLCWMVMIGAFLFVAALAMSMRTVGSQIDSWFDDTEVVAEELPTPTTDKYTMTLERQSLQSPER